jgi:GNAT superfamily N-acetyltransferase
MAVEIKVANTAAERKAYIKFAWNIYRPDPELNKYWVPPVIPDYMKMTDKNKFPLYDHADIQLFTAHRNGEMVGTIAAIENRRHNEFHKDKVGFFGFFECINDQEVANALFDAAKRWLNSKGLIVMRGPVNPSMNDTCGMLVTGYDSSPVLLMTYNPPYYLKLCENYGLAKAEDLLAYLITQDTMDKTRLRRICDIVRKREKVTIRKVNMKKFEAEVALIREMYNEAWEANWGFVPMTVREFDALATDLKPVADPDFIYIVEDENGKPVGFSLSLPDMNIALKHVNGNPFTPWGLAKLLWYSRKIPMLRTIVMGVIPAYRGKGIDALMNLMIADEALKKGVVGSEMSWILENNAPMSRIAESMGGTAYKRYRIYEKDIEK